MNPILERSACILCGGYAAESLLPGIGGPRTFGRAAEAPAPFLFEGESRMPGRTRGQGTGRSAGLRSRLS